MIPVYGAPELLAELVERIRTAAGALGVGYEIILVDDCGPGDAWARIAAETARDSRVRGLRLTRNHGQHTAIRVGLAYARGEWVSVLDCDLQDRPEELVTLWAAAQRTGADQVLARRVYRPDGWTVRMGSWLFYQLLKAATGHRYDASVANFGLYRRQVIASVLSQKARWPFFPVQAQQAGGVVATVVVRAAPRPSGRSSYTLWRRAQLALQVLADSLWPSKAQALPLAYFLDETIPPTISAA